MRDDTVPVRTPGGQSELGTRSLRLSQRHRTVLFLVDGRRSAAAVKHLAAQAGVSAACFDELLALDLIALPANPGAEASVAAAPAGAETPAPRRVDAAHATDAIDTVVDSLLPAAGTLPPDSLPVSTVHLKTQPAPAWPPADPNEPLSAPPDAAFVRARDTLLRVVRSEAPLAGSLTLMRLRRASSRADLAELLAEVEVRIGKRHRSLASAQTLKSVRMLLSSPVTSRPMP